MACRFFNWRITPGFQSLAELNKRHSVLDPLVVKTSQAFSMKTTIIWEKADHAIPTAAGPPHVF